MLTHILGKSYENVKLAEMSKAESPEYDGLLESLFGACSKYQPD